MKNVLLACTSALGFAGPAFAGNPDPISPVVPVVVPAAAGADWDGFYLGATYGTRIGGNLRFDTSLQGNLLSSDIYSSLEPGQNYGGFAGYNIQRNKLVFGGEVAYTAVDTPGFGPVGFSSEYFEYFIDGKARVGVALNNVLLYGFVGYSSSQYSQGTNNWTVGGMNYGAGVDLMLGSRFFVGAEYIARDMSGTVPTFFVSQEQTVNIQEVQVRAGVKF